jgi:DivIVA domain-containing protein
VTFFHVVLVLAVVGLVAAVATGKVRGGLPAPTSSRPDLDLPSAALTPADIDTVRFSVGLRGYRMDEVDAVLDRLSEELGAREQEIAELRQQAAGPTPGETEATPVVAAPEEPARSDEPAPSDGPGAPAVAAIEHLPERRADAEHQGSEPA